jgi:hypothetical protein
MPTINVSITAPITLVEYAKTLPTNDPSRTFVENMVKSSDLMATIPFLPATQGKKAFSDIASLPTTGFRALNTAGTDVSGTFNLREEDTFFIDEYIKVDRAIVDRLGMEHRAKQENLLSIALGQFFSQQVIKGDRTSNPSSPDGMQVRCPTLNVNNLHNSVASGGAALSLFNLDNLYWLVNKPTNWIFPRSLMPFADAAARNSTLTGSTFYYEKIEGNDFGRRVIRYKGLPILFGYEPDDTPDMLPMTEVAFGGGGAVTGSIYCVSLRDGGFYAIEQTSLSAVDEGLIVGQPFYSTHVKWDWGIAREHPRSLARLDSISAAAFVA